MFFMDSVFSNFPNTNNETQLPIAPSNKLTPSIWLTASNNFSSNCFVNIIFLVSD